MAFGSTAMIEKLVERLDIDALVRDFMGKIHIQDLDLFFVVDNQPYDHKAFAVVGMAYSLEAAQELIESKRRQIYDPRILQLDLGRILWLLTNHVEGTVKEVG